jgi:hypothetical protein
LFCVTVVIIVIVGICLFKAFSLNLLYYFFLDSVRENSQGKGGGGF